MHKAPRMHKGAQLWSEPMGVVWRINALLAMIFFDKPAQRLDSEVVDKTSDTQSATLSL